MNGSTVEGSDALHEPRTIIVGAGLAGLAAAVALGEKGRKVIVFEAAAKAGGRCRSYHDPVIDLDIDNGNHLVMSGNQAVARYLKLTRAEARLVGPKAAAFAFVDLASGERWEVRPNASAAPWWIFRKKRRPPGSRASDFLQVGGLLRGGADVPVSERLRCEGPVWTRLMEPFLVAALNTAAASGSARLAGAVVKETLARGGDAYRPRIAHPTLAAAFVDPAIAAIETAGGEVRTGRRVRALTMSKARVEALVFADETFVLGPKDAVILAVPPWAASDFLPGLTVPTEHRAILNGHFRCTPPPGAAPLVGVLGGLAEWIFAFEDRISVTVSAADRWMDADREELSARLWDDVRRVHGLEGPAPPWQIVKEKRATFAATVEQNALRPDQSTAFANLVLAGDWVQTGLPATIEGALRSGFRAADLLSRRAGMI